MVVSAKSHRFSSFIIFSSLSMYLVHGNTVPHPPHQSKDVSGENLAGTFNNDLEGAKPAIEPPKWRNNSKMLRCHCDHCSETNYICETDGICFYSWELINEKHHFSKRCLERLNLVLTNLDTLPECQSNPLNNSPISGKACCETDVCNNETAIQTLFDNRQFEVPVVQQKEDIDMLSIVFCAFIACIFVIIISSVLIMLRRKQNSGGQQLLTEKIASIIENDHLGPVWLVECTSKNVGGKIISCL